MKQRYPSKSNDLKRKLWIFFLFALLLGGKDLLAQNWNPYVPRYDNPYANAMTGNVENHFIVKTDPENSNQFFVYPADELTAWMPSGQSFNHGPFTTMNAGNIHLYTDDRSIKITFHTSAPIQLAGCFVFYSGKNTITLELGYDNQDYPDYCSPITLQTVASINPNSIGENYGIFTFRNRTALAPDCKLIIRGAPEAITDTTVTSYANGTTFKQFVIDGGANVDATPSGDNYKSQFSGINHQGPLIRMWFGTVELQNVTVQNYWNNRGGSAAVVFINNAEANHVGASLTMNHCRLTKCAAYYPGVMLQYTNRHQNTTSSATLNYCRFDNCVAANEDETLLGQGNAPVRSLSGSRCDLTMNMCTSFHNFGGGIRWQSVGANPAVFNNILVKDNFNPENGGGFFLKAGASLNGCKVINNRARGKGGGIFYSYFEEYYNATNPGETQQMVYQNLKPRDAILRMDASTEIIGNTATSDGGGMAVETTHISPYNYDYYYSFNAGGSVTGEFLKTEFYLEGATIENNTSINGNGGGVYISRDEKAFFYGTNCFLKHGKITNNRADNGNGGGIYIYSSDETTDPTTSHSPIYGTNHPNPGDFKPKDIKVVIGMDNDETNKMEISENTSKKGAGVYVEGYDVEYDGYKAKVTLDMFNYSEVYKNIATSDGGGVYVHNGKVSILKTKDVKKPTIGGADATYANKAGDDDNQGNGGGLYLNTGDIVINQGVINFNQASAEGGGLYVNEGNVTTDVETTEPVDVPTPSFTLPEGFQQVEWIASAGTAYIQTNISVSGQHTIYAIGARNGGSSFFVGCGTSTTNRIGVKLNTSTWQYYWRINNSGPGTSNISYNGININNPTQFVMNNTGVWLSQNNTVVKVAYSGPDANMTEQSWRLFKTHEDAARAKIYRAKIYDADAVVDTETGEVTEGTLLGDFIPCYRTVNGTITIGMFDQVAYAANPDRPVEEYFLTNAASSESFTKGPDVFGGRSLGAGVITDAATGVSTDAATIGTRALTGGCEVSYNTAGTNGGGICLKKGNIFLLNSEIKENRATNGNGGGVYDDDGRIFVNYWNATTPGGIDNLTVRGETTATTITNNYAGGNGGGVNTHLGQIFMRGQTPTQDIIIANNTANTGSGGGIFCMGDSDSNDREQIRLINVNIHHNKAEAGDGVTNDDGVVKGCGGGVYLQHGIINITKCELQNNTAIFNGGGINNHGGTINVKGCHINNNEAGKDNSTDGAICSGGGIFTVQGDVNLNNYKDGLSTYHRTEIVGNKAKSNGGGITTRQGKVTAIGEYTADRSKCILINGNEAKKGSGGGVFCLGVANSNSEYILLRNVDMENNQAVSGTKTTQVPIAGGMVTVYNGCGGGIYLQEGIVSAINVKINNNFANVNGGGINNHSGDINIEGCPITYNKADNSGGGIYTNEGNVDLQDHIVNLEGSLNHLETVVDHNEAKENGGGIDTKKGTITINFDKTTNLERESDHQIEVTYNKAKKGGGIYANAGTIIAANAKIDNNFATENGGGINNHAGDITIYGGSLNNNTSQHGKGGGAFTYVGDIDIFPFPVNWSTSTTQPTLNNGTMIYNNIANLNGGGLNNHTGRIDIRHARLKNNTSTLGNGGGIFCEGPHTNSTGFTIRLLHSELVQNKTRGQDGTAADPTGRGGGIYLKYGSIYAHASDILFNSANINGGGLDNHDGNILIYGCNLIGNKAVTGNGGGIYTQSGDITSGPCIDRNDPTKSKASVIQQNEAHINGGGINNHNGNIFINGDHIGGIDNSDPDNPISLGNIAKTGHGGGIYIANGIIDMYGGRIAYNVAAKGDGGGVYSGGGEFNIQKRQGKPVVEIIDVDPQANGDVTIHYHVIDKGGNNTTVLDSHGIYWGTTEANTQVTFGSGSNYAFVQGESGCFRITIPSVSVPVSEGQTYKVKAYATNKTSQGGDPEEFAYLTDESEEKDFVPYSSIPVVITGSVNEVTAIYAEVYAKIIYDGGAPITGRGVYCAPSADTPSDQWVPFPSDETGDFFLTKITNNNNANPGDTVYVKAYATNSNNKTGYGEIITFITPKDLPNMGNSLVDVTEITSNDALFSFTMPDGTDWSTIEDYGFVISTDDDPEIHADNNHTLVVTTHTSNTFSMKASNHTPDPIVLNPGTTYYVRAFATKMDNAGTDVSNYAVTLPKQFFTKDANGKPVVRAIEISGITRTKATITGKIVYQGSSSSPITFYGVCFSDTNVAPTDHDNNCNHIEVFGNVAEGSTFDINIPVEGEALRPNTTYYLRLFASNATIDANNPVAPSEVQISYSNDYNFTTLPVTPPTVKLEVIDIDRTTATVRCTVNDGGHNLTDNGYGIRWKKASEANFNDTHGTNLGQDGNAPNVYTIALSSLDPNTEYVVKAYAANGTGANNDGTGLFEGREIMFTTGYNKPHPSDVTVNSITFNPSQTGDDKHKINVKGSATIGETGQTIKHFGFVYSVNPNPTMYSVQGVDEWDCGYVEATQNTDTELKSKVNPNKIYYVRAYASSVNSPTSDADYEYGNDTTILTLPEVIAQSAMPTNNSAQLTATINHADLNHHLRHIGVCWNTSGDPTIANSNTGVDIVSSTPTATTFTFSTSENLVPGSTYFCRAYAWNENYDDDPESPTYNDPNCIAYSNQLSFTPYQYKINLAVVPSVGGSLTGQVTVPGTGYFLGGMGYVNSVGSGENVTLTAMSANDNYQIEMWTYTDGGSINDTVWLDDNHTELFTNNAYAFNPSGNYTYTVWYKSRIAFSSGGNGSVSGKIGDNTIYSGDLHPYETIITLTAHPATGYVVDYWEKDGETLMDDNGDPVNTTTLNITVDAAASYKVYFKQNRRSASLNSGSRPRDIYPAPAREPWDWDDDCTFYRHGGLRSAVTSIDGAMTDTVPEVEDEALREVRERLSRDGVIEPEDIPHIIENKATEGRGGGVFVDYNVDNPSKIRFSGGENEAERGKINNNYAKLAGGGVYISLDATLFMRYYCEVNNNHVDAIVNDGKQRGGGGIYLDGILKVGENPDDAEDIHSLKVDGNWAGVELQYEPSLPNVNNRNNVYLPEDPIPLPESESWNALNGLKPDGVTPLEKPDKQRVITLLSNIAGKYDEIDPSTGQPVINPETNEPQTAYYTRIGISVDHGFRGVIYTPMKAGTPEDHGDETLSHEKWLIDLVPSQGGALESAFFDDANMYYALHVQNVNNPDDLKRQYDYLYGCWTTAVRIDPRNDHDKFPLPDGFPEHFTIDEPDTWHIYTKYGLAWFTSWVNGLNGNVGHPDAKAFIERDMDMREHIWIPIGTTEPYPGYGTEITFRDGGAYVGEFNGQGHLITGLQCRYATGVKKYGLFGTVSKSVTIKKLVKNDQGQITESGELITVDGNGIVKNTFVDDYRYWTFRIGEQETYAYKIGGIAGEVAGGGTVCASEARGLINIPECVPDQSYVGGLVGKMEGTAAVPAQGENPAVPEMPAVVHSSMAMPEIKGMAKYVGGLVGYLGATDNLLNSFSNSKFTGSPYNNSITVGGSTETVYFGGLVGVNNGLVENCYTRLQGNEPQNSSNQSIFGWLAGTNNTDANANINYCYGAKEMMDSPGVTDGGKYIKIGTDPSGHGTYTATQRYSGKYGFKHRDHKITAADANTTLFVTEIDATGLTNQSFGGGGSNGSGNSGNSQQPATLSTTTSGGLMTILNAWVELNYKANEVGKNYATWTRTMASPINDDYPVPMLTTKNNTEKFNSVGSIDCIYLLYEDNVNAMWTGDNGKHFDTITPNRHPHAAMYLYDVQPLAGGKPDNVTITGNAKAPLYINEEIGITQPDKDVDNNIPALTARVGVTIKNARDDESNPNWHLFSSALYRTKSAETKGVPLGIEYHTDKVESYDSPGTNYVTSPGQYIQGNYYENIPNKVYHKQEVWASRRYFDPPKTTWSQSTKPYFNGSSTTGYFPTNTPYGTWRTKPYTDYSNQNGNGDYGFFDLYEYNEYFYHWINYKREGTESVQDHWHWDKDIIDDGKRHYRLGYNGEGEGMNENFINDTEWVPGKGYLMALSSESMMMADGILNTGNVNMKITKSGIWENMTPNGHGTYNYTEEWRKLNMLGNPYQSYLDFNEFISINGGKLERQEYAVVDDSQGPEKEYRYIYYVNEQSVNWPYSASRYIHPHQGFFVKAASSGEITFNNDMRVAGKSTDSNINSPYRGEVNYPLVNLLCYDEDGRRDLTTVEVNRPEFGGGHKMEKLHESKGLIYAHLENESFQTLFTPVGINVVPVRFVPNEDGIFTLNWNTRHGEFSYLHLIDNIAGVDVDCLTNDEYKFEGKTSDYKSRFKLVFRCDGDEPEDPEEPDDGDDSDHFAFMFGDELVVNGAGLLQMFDIQGRCLMETRAVGEQSSHRIPRVSAGVYLLRLTGESKVKVQKIVIK